METELQHAIACNSMQYRPSRSKSAQQNHCELTALWLNLPDPPSVLILGVPSFPRAGTGVERTWRRRDPSAWCWPRPTGPGAATGALELRRGAPEDEESGRRHRQDHQVEE